MLRARRKQMEAQRATQIQKWFKGHVATLQTYTAPDSTTVEILDWKNPSNGFYAVRYVSDGRWLYVSGDIGAASYYLGARVDLREWSKVSLSYFAEKCEASDNGRKFAAWSEEAAWLYVRDCIANSCPSKRRVFTRLEGRESLYSEESWRERLSMHGYKVFGCEYYECGDAGEVTSMRCEGHLTGLKLAFAQLDVSVPTPASPSTAERTR